MKCVDCKRLAVDVCDLCQKPLCTECKKESDYCLSCDDASADDDDDDDDDDDSYDGDDDDSTGAK